MPSKNKMNPMVRTCVYFYRSDHDRYKKAAEIETRTVSNWMRHVLNKAADKCIRSHEDIM